MNRWIELIEDADSGTLSSGKVLAWITTLFNIAFVFVDAYGHTVNAGLVGLMQTGYVPLLGGQVRDAVGKLRPPVQVDNVESVEVKP